MLTLRIARYARMSHLLFAFIIFVHTCTATNINDFWCHPFNAIRMLAGIRYLNLFRHYCSHNAKVKELRFSVQEYLPYSTMCTFRQISY